ncbi:hypothetical protein Scep_019940 [Stephania cephalantha]|uniref:Uncharacterized protein n=1 Tax=Stephania cephalantha TaxID=152367 RepID=A0AAP0NQC1_9MAGN
MGFSALKSVNNGAQKLSGYVKDSEIREKIGWYIAYPLTHEGLNLISASHSCYESEMNGANIGVSTVSCNMTLLSYAVGLAEATVKHRRGLVSNGKKVEFLVEQMNREIKEMQAENKQLKAELESIK